MEAYKRISVESAQALMREQPVYIVDVRAPDDYRAGHIDEAIPATEEQMQKLIRRGDRSIPVIVYCYHGNSSRNAAELIAQFGFNQVYSMDGGYEAWRTGASAAQQAVMPDEATRDWLVSNGFGGDDVNICNAHGFTPLMLAARQGNEQCAADLIRCGADIDRRNADGNNALWFACYGRSPAVMRLLITHGVNTDNQNDNGATVLMYAASSGNLDAVQLLVQSGADQSLRNPDDFSALDLASTRPILQLLRGTVVFG